MAKRYHSGTAIGGVDLANLNLDAANRRKNAAVLAAGYTPLKRRFELATMTLFLTLECVVGYTAVQNSQLSRDWLLIIAMFIVGQVATDMVSGWVHWTCDTWGRLDTPVFGPTFIRSFREHHVDPTAMCNHDFIETNADPSLPSVILNLYLVFWHGFRQGSRFDLGLYYFALFGGVFAAFTNEFHKWAHLTHAPWWIDLLQRLWIVLPRKHHGLHHRPPFDRNYCIATGHLNWLLDTVGYWRAMEAVIQGVTGFKPREDDALWTQQLYETQSNSATNTVPK